MRKMIISFLTLICLVALLQGCGQKKQQEKLKPKVFVFQHEPCNAVYHWKSALEPNSYEMQFMKKHNVKRMYVKFFDVSTDNLYDGQGEIPVPIATTIFRNSPKQIQQNNIEIVPVVFITVEALRTGKPLAEKLLQRVDAMCKANKIKYNEIQFDCDWTKETKVSFFKLCKEARQKLHKNKKGLSSTIRLHQLRYDLPDVDYGVLMLYNTESLQNPDVENSIISSKAVKEYMSHAKSKVHLDFAYPTYEWDLWFKNNKFMGIVSDDKLREGTIRHEKSDYKEIMATKQILKSSLKNIGYPSSTIIYHLDSTNLSKYTDNEIENIYSR